MTTAAVRGSIRAPCQSKIEAGERPDHQRLNGLTRSKPLKKDYRAFQRNNQNRASARIALGKNPLAIGKEEI